MHDNIPGSTWLIVKAKRRIRTYKRIPPAIAPVMMKHLRPQYKLGQCTYTEFILPLANGNVKENCVIFCTIYLNLFSIEGKACAVSIDKAASPW